MKKITQIAQEALISCIKENGIYADFTLGEGHDSRFLLQYPIGKLYAFEKQKKVLEHTKTLLNDERLIFINDGHENLADYIKEPVDGAIFNFGYYPQGNHGITTQLETSKAAVTAALKKIKKQGRLVLVIYPGHEEGKKESEHFAAWAKTLPSHFYAVGKITMENKQNCPWILIIERVRYNG